MSNKKLDLRQIPANERHQKIHKKFEKLNSGETLTIINDHEPKPLFYEMKAEIEKFDDKNYEVKKENKNKYIAKLPKKPK